MDIIKESFNKVKQDIEFLREELDDLRKELIETREKLVELGEIVEKISSFYDKEVPTHRQNFQAIPTHIPTHPTYLEPLKPQNLGFSTGNEGVPTDRQTDRQTDQQTENWPKTPKNSFENAVEILDSLDSIKKEIRIKFKKLTEQEILIFSTIYQIEEEIGYADYKTLAKRLHLTESSVRDYVGRLLNKGIPVDKKKINNKQIQLIISPNLKRIVSLSTILQLREL